MHEASHLYLGTLACSIQPTLTTTRSAASLKSLIGSATSKSKGVAAGWPSDEAEELDDRGKFAEAVRDALGLVLRLAEEPSLPESSSADKV